MKIVIATHNAKKLDELRRILLPLGFEAVILPDLPDVEETGATFAENARLKAAAGCAFSGLPCVGDDSGLCVDALGGAPGVYSARYAGEHGNDGANIAKLLEILNGATSEGRTAHCPAPAARFVCAICCIFPDGCEIALERSCEGGIATAPTGEGGFGYDPIFLPEAYPGRTMAQLSAVEKDAISHRGKALAALADQLKTIII